MTRTLLGSLFGALTLLVPVDAAQFVTATHAWARATAPGMTVGAIYLTLTGGSVNDRVVAASLDGAERVEIHEVRDGGGVSGMRQVASLEVPAGASIKLAPNGVHMMVIGLAQPLVAGQTRRLNVRLERAGTLSVAVLVRPATAVDDGAHEH